MMRKFLIVVSWFLFLLGFPFLFFESLYESAHLPRQLALVGFALYLSFFTLGEKAQRFSWDSSGSLLKKLLFALLGSFILSLSVALDPYWGLWGCLQWASLAFLSFFLATYFPPAYFPTLALALILAGTGISWIGLAQAFGDFCYYPQTLPPSASFFNKNFAAEYLVAILPLSFWSLFLVPRSWFWGALLAFYSQGIYLVYTKSRASGLALFLTFLILGGLAYRFPLLAKKWKEDLLRLWILGVAFLLTLFLFYKAPPEDYFQTKTLPSSGVSTVQQRLTLWTNAWAMIWEAPFLGKGFENFYAWYPHYHRAIVWDRTFQLAQQPYALHQDLLQIWVECGMFGLFSMLALLYFSLRRFYQGLHAEMSSSAFWKLAFALGTFAVFINSHFSFPLRNPSSAFLFWIGLGILWSSPPTLLKPSPEKTRGLRSDGHHSSRSSFIALLFLILCGFCWGYGSFLWIRSNIHLKRALEWAHHPSQYFQTQYKTLEEISVAYFYAPWDIQVRRELSILQAKVSPVSPRTQKILEDIRIRDPYYFNNILNLAYLYQQQNLGAQAEKEYFFVLEHLPQEPHAFYGLGLLALQQDKALQARTYFESALSFCQTQELQKKIQDQLQLTLELLEKK
jgi:O-antigen ligase